MEAEAARMRSSCSALWPVVQITTGQTARLTVIEQTLSQRGVRKVDDNIAVTLILRKILVDREICVLFGANIKADSDFHAVAAADDIANHTAHAAAAAGKRDF